MARSGGSGREQGDGTVGVVIVCAVCGAPAEGADLAGGIVPWGWMVDREAGGPVTVVCPGCARRHARDIEGKLDGSWW